MKGGFKVIAKCSSSPQGLRFRSRASLHAFLLKNPHGNLDINLFDFAAPKNDKLARVSSVKQTRAKKKPAGRPQEVFTDILDAPPSDPDSSTIRNALVGSSRTKINAAELKTGTTSGTEPAAGQTSPQRAASLREKLLKLVPAASQQNTSPAAVATSQPPSAEPAAESEKLEVEEARICGEGDDGSKSDGDAVASGSCDGEEVSLPEVTAARESQNSK